MVFTRTEVGQAGKEFVTNEFRKGRRRCCTLKRVAEKYEKI
jgi:hypothetical protein